ncbi:6-hydroxymethylpterin diphosphokinase MptE-like protein [Domibacillus robiginosus]|uniref:motility associated factor glycosyltransferase family protein n=1 Tax=Domibacillus robiginosus TaxID=1071054 RepID=UPI00067CBF89|nr:6-hydroxymethylpterin diphosphokinase MptE-like protein [Domibacillus robiginosus]
MMLTDNRNYLRIHQRPLLEELTKYESVEEPTVEVEPSRKGIPTAKMMIKSKVQYVHSKYDPESEAARLVEKINDIHAYSHVLFIGSGLGYHIKSFLKEHPKVKISIYEPNLEMLIQFLTHQNITDFPKGSLQKIITTSKKQDLKQEIEQLHKLTGTKTFVYLLPSLTKLYENEEKMILEYVKGLLKEKRSEMATNFSFQKRWTINSIKNFPKVLQTPNILHDIDREVFRGKPAIIAAAGPSLSEEFENLQYIKENGLAYIFSVGSAINALIEHNIYPDAACTYDPKSHNYTVVEAIKNKGIKEIPLVFGSSVGYETLERYPGKMLHMLTSQDTVAPRYINNPENINVVLDAPSIAVVTFQLLQMLGCSQIILAGQNLSFQNKKRYAAGINYEHTSSEINDDEEQKLISILDVHGNEVKTDETYTKMRQQLEAYIKLFSNLEVINTTNGGARIEGTTFMPMSQVIQEKLRDRQVVGNWYKGTNQYDYHFVQRQMNKMNIQQKACEISIEQAFNELKEIDKLVKLKRTTQLERSFIRFDRCFSELRENLFFKSFIEPMVRIHHKLLSEKSQEVRFEKDLKVKGETIVHIFLSFLIDCQKHIEAIMPYIQEMNEEIEKVTKENK